MVGYGTFFELWKSLTEFFSVGFPVFTVLACLVLNDLGFVYTASRLPLLAVTSFWFRADSV
jgi:hypothetical protein